MYMNSRWPVSRPVQARLAQPLPAPSFLPATLPQQPPQDPALTQMVEALAKVNKFLLQYLPEQPETAPSDAGKSEYQAGMAEVQARREEIAQKQPAIRQEMRRQAVEAALNAPPLVFDREEWIRRGATMRLGPRNQDATLLEIHKSTSGAAVSRQQNPRNQAWAGPPAGLAIK